MNKNAPPKKYPPRRERRIKDPKSIFQKISSAAARIVASGVAFALLSAPRTDVYGSFITQPAPRIITRTEAARPVSRSPVLAWTEEEDAIAYEIEIFSDVPPGLSPSESDARAVYRTSEVYDSAVNLLLDGLREKYPEPAPLWWRVRALDLERQPISPFSALVPLYTSADLPRMNAPLPKSLPGFGRGSAMIYPVYSWVKQYGTDNFEVALYDEDPDKNPAAEPIYTMSSEIAERYDDMPRVKDPLYWRVRAVDSEGMPGNWSFASRLEIPSADGWEVAVFGDSISHGGGHLSFGPEHLEYSWLHYLDFPALNLSQSGNLTESMLARFDADVLPFHPKYLLIMGGTNDLRSDEFTVENAIRNMDMIEEKCIKNGIKPIFITIPPINPENIYRAFNEPTDERWRQRFNEFNAYLRTKTHIDAAAAFAPYSKDGTLPEWLGLDGLHEDVIGKQLIAARVNAEWPKIIKRFED